MHGEECVEVQSEKRGAPGERGQWGAGCREAGRWRPRGHGGEEVDTVSRTPLSGGLVIKKRREPRAPWMKH